MTEEEKKEAQINADLDHTKELFGISKSLDEFSLNSKEDYQDYVNRLYAKINLQNVFIFSLFIYVNMHYEFDLFLN